MVGNWLEAGLDMFVFDYFGVWGGGKALMFILGLERRFMTYHSQVMEMPFNMVGVWLLP